MNFRVLPSDAQVDHSVFSFACTEQQSTRQSQFLNRAHSSCFFGEPWAAFYSTGFACEAPVFVIVGANKGYAIAEFLGIWRPDLGTNPVSLGEALLKKFPDIMNHCGHCNDCLDTPLPSLLPQELRNRCASHARIFAFEPLPVNIELLDDVLRPLIFKKYSESGSAHLTHAHADVSFQVLNMAVTGQRGAGSIGFKVDCDRGSELCRVSNSSQHQVPATTMDEWFEKQSFRHVDIMMIDVEGHDPDILDGARDMLKSHAVKVLVFEYNDLGSWKTRDLEPIVSRLDTFGYDCFLPQQESTVLRLTKCWNKAYDVKGWMNVMCVLRKEVPLLAAMNSLVPLRRPEKKPERSVSNELAENYWKVQLQKLQA